MCKGEYRKMPRYFNRGKTVRLCLIFPDMRTKKAFDRFAQPLYVTDLVYTMLVEKDGKYNEAQVKRLVSQGLDAFITWDKTYRKISHQYPCIPVFQVRPAAVDILNAVRLYKGKRVGIVGSSELYCDWKNLSRVVAVPPVRFFCCCDPGSELQVQELKARVSANQVDVLLAEQELCYYLRQYTISCRAIDVGCNTVWQHLCRAMIFFRLNDRAAQKPGQAKREKSCGQTVQYTMADIIGESMAMQTIKQQAAVYAQTDSTILITGESGTGKELLAQAIHQLSNRKNGPFLAINCSALNDSLLESELFGYADGTFTGGIKGGKKGIFEAATGGTLFLDEIGDMNITMQNRLLRVLEEKYVRPLGSQKTIPVDVRIIAATNQNLEKAVEEKRFRLDLYYRLEVLHIHIPPLRIRGDDIEKISLHFLQQFNKLYEKYKEFDPAVLKYFRALAWPGNVRQLSNIIERLVLLSSNSLITVQDMKMVVMSQHTKMPHGTLRDIARQMIRSLEAEGRTVTEIAEQLGVSRATVYRLKQGAPSTGHTVAKLKNENKL